MQCFERDSSSDVPDFYSEVIRTADTDSSIGGESKGIDPGSMLRPYFGTASFPYIPNPYRIVKGSAKAGRAIRFQNIDRSRVSLPDSDACSGLDIPKPYSSITRSAKTYGTIWRESKSSDRFRMSHPNCLANSLSYIPNLNGSVGQGTKTTGIVRRESQGIDGSGRFPDIRTHSACCIPDSYRMVMGAAEAFGATTGER